MLLEAPREGRQRVPRLPRRDLLLASHRPVVPERVPHVTVGLALDVGRTLAGPPPLDRRAHRRPHRVHVHPVHHLGRNAEARGARRDVLPRLGDGIRGGHRVLVVLADDDDRQLPHRREVQGLVEDPLVGGPVPVERDRDPALAPEPRRHHRPRRVGDAGADEPVAPEHVEVEVGDVHRPALAAAVAVRAPEELRHHRPDVRALRDAVPVAAVGAGDEVVVREIEEGADRDPFLPHAGVGGAVDLALAEEGDEALLEGADAPHEAVHPEVVGEVRRLVWPGGGGGGSGGGSVRIRIGGKRVRMGGGHGRGFTPRAGGWRAGAAPGPGQVRSVPGRSGRGTSGRIGADHGGQGRGGPGAQGGAARRTPPHRTADPARTARGRTVRCGAVWRSAARRALGRRMAADYLPGSS